MTDHEQPEPSTTPAAGNALLLIFSWLWVSVPLAWGVWETYQKSKALWR